MLLHGTNYTPYETWNSIHHHYEDIYENSENLSKVTPVYGTLIMRTTGTINISGASEYNLFH